MTSRSSASGGRGAHYANYRARLDGLLTKPVEVTLLRALDY
jgi:hypothetical protein